MSFNIEEISNTEKLAKVVIEKSLVKANHDSVVKLFQKDADIKGFRKGKVPLNVVESLYSKQINEELKSRLINISVRDLSTEKKFNIVRTSNLEVQELNKESDFEFKINIEIIPEFKLKEYKKIKVKKEVFKLDKKDFNSAKENVLNNFAKTEEVSKRKKVKKGDYVEISFSGFLNDKEIEKLKRDNAIVQIGNDSLIPDIEKEILKLEKGEESNFNVEYPKDFPIEEAASKKINCKLKIIKILKKVVPKIDKDFLQKIGIASEEDLDKRINDDLNASLEQKSISSLRKNLFDKLIDDNDFDFPQSFVGDEKIRLEQDYKNKMNQQGIKVEDLDEKTQSVIADSAFRNVKIALIFAEISKLEKIFVENNEVEDYLKAFAVSQNTPPEKVIRYYKENNLLEDVRVKLTDEKVINFLIENADVKEVKADSKEKKEKKEKK